MRDLHNNLKITQLVDPAALTADTTSASIDMKGYDSAELIVNIGEGGVTLDATNYFQFAVYESSDNTVFTAVAAADLLTKGNAITAPSTGVFAVVDATDEDDAVYKVGYVGGERYVHVLVDAVGTHGTGTPIAVTGVRGNPALGSVN